MVKEAPSLKYDAKKSTAANEGGFGLLARLDKLEGHRQSDLAKIEGLETRVGGLATRVGRLEIHRQSHLDLRQRAISTWVRDALGKDTQRRNDAIRKLNRDVIHGGDIRSDAMVVTERYERKSTEWKSFQTLYGLTPDNVGDLGIVYEFPWRFFYR